MSKEQNNIDQTSTTDSTPVVEQTQAGVKLEEKSVENTNNVESQNVEPAAQQSSPAQHTHPRNSGYQGGGRRRGNNNRRQRRDTRTPEEKEFTETLVKLNRVAKVLKGGRRFSFSALVVVGNKKGKVGYGFGKAGDVSEAIRKAMEHAKKQIVEVKMYKSTIPHWVVGKSNTSQVLLKPAAPGTGIIAGGPVRIILEMAGCPNILSKCRGSRNASNVVKATFDGLSQILSAKEVARVRGKEIKEIWS